MNIIFIFLFSLFDSLKPNIQEESDKTFIDSISKSFILSELISKFNKDSIINFNNTKLSYLVKAPNKEINKQINQWSKKTTTQWIY